MKSAWFQRLQPRAEAPNRLFCLAHAGGAASAYRLWPAHFPELDICAVQLPGRANRMREPALQRMSDIVDALVPEFMPLLDRPYAIFGHSMGAIIASALIPRLVAAGAAAPRRLFASASQGPRWPVPAGPPASLADADFVLAICREYGGIPAEVLAVPELVEMVLPTLRADFAALASHVPGPAGALPCPVTAFGGREDACTPLEQLMAWQAETPHPLAVRQFDGGHFYLDGQLAAVGQEIRAALGACATPAPIPGAAG